MKKIVLLLICLSMVSLNGCGYAVKRSPHMFFGEFEMHAQIERKDMVIMNVVEGRSSQTNFLGIVQIIDGDKIQILGIPLFKDKITYFERGNKVLNRAYYKALEAEPDADVIFQKSYHVEVEGIPFLIGTRSVMVRGRAMRLIPD